MRHKPYSVVLLDEIEKAHPDIFNLLLQLLDDGRLTDNKSRTVNFRNVIVIMTSNLGSDIIRDKMEKRKDKMPEHEEELLRNEIMLLLRRSFRPEFLNRVDEIVMFTTLTIDQIGEIVKIQLNRVYKMLGEYDLKMVVTDEALDWLTQRGYDLQSGARPVKRLIQKEIINEVSKEIIGGKVTPKDTIVVDVEDGHLCSRHGEKH